MYKQIIIARKDLNMSPGKLAAQVSHASTAFLVQMIKENTIGEIFHGAGVDSMQPIDVYRINAFDIQKELFDEWINDYFAKTVLGAKNKYQLLKAKMMAEELGMHENRDFFLIKDCCHTELKPEEVDENGIGRTLTCIGFAPMDTNMIDKIGKKYQLY